MFSLSICLSSILMVYFHPKGSMHENDKLCCNNSARMVSFLLKRRTLKESHNDSPYPCGE